MKQLGKNILPLSKEDRAWVILVKTPVSFAGMSNQTTRVPGLAKLSFSFVLQEESLFINELYVEEETVPSIRSSLIFTIPFWPTVCTKLEGMLNLTFAFVLYLFFHIFNIFYILSCL